MKYNFLKLDIGTFGGRRASSFLEFSPGATLILTDDNTQGKSTLINALAVGLGFDDLVKSNVTALVKDQIKIDGKDRSITDAAIFVEIENQAGQKMSIKREIKPDFSPGILVFHGPLKDWDERRLEEFYVGKNSYIDTRGFHRHLCEFIGFPDIQVVSSDDEASRLYFEYILSAVFIEQKRGWSDIMANAPYYRVKDPKKSTIAELLGLSYLKTSLLRNGLKVEVDRLANIYTYQYDVLVKLIRSKGFALRGVSADVTSETWNPHLVRIAPGLEDRLLPDILSKLRVALKTLDVPVAPTPDNEAVSTQILEISKTVANLIARRRELDTAIASATAALGRYQQRMDTLVKDLKKNKEEQKIEKIFSGDRWAEHQQCPVCDRPVDGTLLSQLRSFPTMTIGENVKYIEEQKELLESVIKVEQSKVAQLNEQSLGLGADITTLIAQHGELQRSLSGALPADLMARAREIARVEQEIARLEELAEDFADATDRLGATHQQYLTKSKRLSKLKSDLSEEDRTLVRNFQTVFRRYLTDIGFNSFETSALLIDEYTFLPRVMINGADQRKRMRADFGSSASDWIRIIIAFTLALHACRKNSLESRHPNISIFDEPLQQNMNRQDYLKIFDCVAEVAKGGGQVIIAATDEFHDVRARAHALGMKVIDFQDQYILQ